MPRELVGKPLLRQRRRPELRTTLAQNVVRRLERLAVDRDRLTTSFASPLVHLLEHHFMRRLEPAHAGGKAWNPLCQHH